MPTGSLVGRYASAIEQLVKLANICDSIGQPQAADILTDATKELIVDLDTKRFF